MIVSLDNTFLSLIFNPRSIPRPDPATSQPAEFCAERIDALIDEHSRRGDVILIPTPCLAEMLCAVGDFEKVLAEIAKSSAFDIAAFDVRAAIELADETRKALASGDKKAGVKASWQEIKFDRQIAAIAKAGRAEVFYTDDENQSFFAARLGLKVKHTWELDLPAKFRQKDLWDQGSDEG